jgi:hypothetical protein
VIRPVIDSLAAGPARLESLIALWGITLLAVTGAALASLGSPAGHPAPLASRQTIVIIPVTPAPVDIGGVFNVDVVATALNATGDKQLSATDGYEPGIANTPAGIGHLDRFAPGLVVLLSTTPQADGGPNANLAGVFQLTDIATSNGVSELIADWEADQAALFGKGTKTTLTTFLVSGKAPGTLNGPVKPISNVIKETFYIGESA